MAKTPQQGDFRAAETESRFATAVGLHQAGRLQEAEQHYRSVLAANPLHVDALHLLGVLAHQVGRSDAAVELIGQALALNDGVPEYHYNIGLAHGALGRFDEAAAHNARAIALRPDYAEAHLNFGNALNAQGRHGEAVESYQRALVLRPSPEAHTNLANALAELGRGDDAVTHYGKALALRPDYADAHNNLGTVRMTQGRAAEAAAHHRRAIGLNPAMTAALVNLGNALRAMGQPEEAIMWYRQALARDPNHPQAQNNLGGALLARGEYGEALACFERALALKPDFAEASVNLARMLIVQGDVAGALRAARQVHRHETAQTRALFHLCLRDPGAIPHAAEYYDDLVRALDEPWGNPRVLTGIAARLILQNPAIRACVARVEAAWPELLPADELFDTTGIAPIAADRLLQALLTTVPNGDIGLERFLTAARAALLPDGVSADGDDARLSFQCGLARQCFINGYVFACPPDEAARVADLQERVCAAIAGGAPVAPAALAALAAYGPLHKLRGADTLLALPWPQPVRAVLDQQVAQPNEEERIRAALPRLTAIRDAVSVPGDAESPYPRWTKTAPTARPQPIDSYLRDRFPLAPFRPLAKPRAEYLVAGCGTGQQVASAALAFSNVQITAIDLRLASLGYAKRMTAALGMDIAFGQADILELGTLGRSFDVIDSSGVLHHLDGDAKWRALLSVLPPGGVMRMALDNANGRSDIEAARRHIAARGLDAADVRQARQARQEIMMLPQGAPARNVTNMIDFFSLGECRELLFHAPEPTSTIPQLKEFLAAQDLVFLGFECEPGALQRYAQRFPDDPARTNLDHWHAFEQDNPDTFPGLYEFWLQKRAD